MRSSWIVAGLVVLIAASAAVASRRPVVRQPIQFNHAKHVAAGVDCDGCHATVEEQSFAGMPDLDTCLQCHDDAPKTADEKKLKAYEASHTQPAWQRLYQEPSHVFFSHRRHVKLAKVPCATCHGAMEKATAPPTRPAVSQTMSWCLSCHRERHASTDCIACHR